MKTIINLCLIAVLSLVAVSCKNNQEPEVKTVAIETTEETAENTLDPNATYAKVEFGIDGMTCAMGCAKTIEKKMAKMEGVKSAKVDFEKELAMVEYDEAKVTPQSLEEAVALAGDAYSVRDMKQVDDFSAEKKACDKENCDKACCKDKKQKQKAKGDKAGEKKGKAMACADDCKKDCCVKKA
jgi:Cu+-exporting ATPase